jgi:hypothetical protein
VASSLALLVFVRSGNASNPLIEKLANFVAGGLALSDTSFYYYPSKPEWVYASIALAEYDKLKGNTKPNLSLVVSTSLPHNTNYVLLKKNFTSPATQASLASTSFDHLGKKLNFDVKGTGEVDIAARMTFVPAETFDQPVERGFLVQKVIRLDNHSFPSGPPLNKASTGTTVIVTIQITLTDDTSNVEVVDLLPGGFEAQDPNIVGGVSRPRCYGFSGFPDWRCYFYFFSQETRSGKVIFRSSFLVAGTYTMQYTALTNVVGDYVLPPTKAFNSFAPEVLGLSKTSTWSTIGPSHDLLATFSPQDGVCL